MKVNPKISAAVAAVLGAPAFVLAAPSDLTAPADQAASTADTGALAEVVVTAERRSERLQDVPITVQAITGEQLAQLNVVSFNELLKYTPNVTFSGNGPGTGNIYIRGLGGIGSGNQSQSTTAAFPNVALYLDDQSMQFPARNNDVYVVDMERIEVLEGPQGTLFGGGAQAGAIRYITNKPKLTATSAEFNAGYGITAGGNPNSNLNAVLNIPLVPDTLALRAVIFNDHRGGYISNVASTISYQPGTPAGNTGVSANNAGLTSSDSNTVTYQGFRLSLLWKMNDDWNLLLQQNYQDMDANGYWYAYPADSNGTALARYQITAFTPAFNKDKYESTAWTLNGKLPGNLSVVYTGSYMDRNIDGQQDYSNYLRSGTGSYYGCVGPGAGYFNPANFPALATHTLQCYSPTGSWRDIVHNTHQSHELRISTDPEQRIRALAGFYWEKFVIDDNMNFNYLSIPQCNTAAQAAAGLAGTGPDCLSAVGPVPGSFASQPGLRLNQNTAFGEDEQRGYKQRAFFASVDFDLIPKVLTLTGGGRLYHYDEFEHGSEWYSESTSGSFSIAPGTGLILDHVNGTCINTPGYCGFPMDLNKSESGSRWRANLTWHITPDVMTYYTFSQGFRPGMFNRTKSSNGQVHLAAEIPFCVGTGPGGVNCKTTYQYEKPSGVSSDNLINNEIGFKSEFLDHRLLIDASAYYMKWKDEQLSLFEPAFFGNTTFNVQGPDFTIKGFEIQFNARITAGLSIQGSSSVNQSTQTNSPCLESVGVDPNNGKTANNPTPKGTCITTDKGAVIPNALGAQGTPPAFSPPWMFNLRARYDWSSGDYHPFAWAGASHIGPMTNEPRNYHPGNDPAFANPPVTTLLLYPIPSYTTYDAALGISKDNWTVQLNGSNLTNVYGPTNVTSGQFIQAVIPLRPRVLSLLMSYRF